MRTKKCEACGRRFQLRPQTPNQTYCPDLACQRIRRLRWQQDKRKTDPDYADNQARAQRAWSERNVDYWKNYRAMHPEYVERNRKNQLDRGRRVIMEEAGGIAKMDSSTPLPTVPSGIYQMSFVSRSGVAKMDVWMVELRVISYSELGKTSVAKRSRVDVAAGSCYLGSSVFA